MIGIVRASGIWALFVAGILLSAVPSLGYAQQSCSGVAISPGSNIQQAVSANPAGTTFCLGAGTFTGQAVTPKDGNSFIGIKGQTKIDGGGVKAGFIDSTTANNVTVRNLEIYDYWPERFAAIDNRHDSAAGSSGWVIENNNIHNNSNALNFGSNSVVRRNHLHHNDRHAMVGGGIDSLFEANEVNHNNLGKHNCGDSCVSKFVLTDGLIVRGNYVHDNNGPGLWDDIENDNITYEENLVVHNEEEGIYHEIGHKAIIRNNIVVNNGGGRFVWVFGAQIMISSSNGSEVYGNTVQVGPGVGNAITVADQTREPGGFNNTVHDNEIIHTVSEGQSAVAFDGQSASRDTKVHTTNHFDHNHYHVPDCGGQRWGWNSAARDFSGMQAQGQEAHGTCDTHITPIDIARIAPEYGLGYNTTGDGNNSGNDTSGGDSVSEACNLTSSGESVAAGFGVPWSTLSSSRPLLLTSQCEGDEAFLRAGTGSNVQYIYKQGYTWDGSAWDPFTFSGAQLIDNNWYVGDADHVLNNVSNGTTFWVGYVCQWTGSEWKCGCRDASCATAYWQLQGVEK